MPCNDFDGLEAGSEASILSAYKKVRARLCWRPLVRNACPMCVLGGRCVAQKYGITFPITGVLNIAKDRHAFFETLADLVGEHAVPTWNFHKILVGKDGIVKGVFPAAMKPKDPQIVHAVVRELYDDSGVRGEFA